MGLIKKISKGVGKGLGEIVTAPLDIGEALIDAVVDDEPRKPKGGKRRPK